MAMSQRAKGETAVSSLRLLREEAGVSREGLMRLLPIELSANQIYRIESGRSSARRRTAEALAQALSKALGRKVTVADIFEKRVRQIEEFEARSTLPREGP